MRRTHNLGELRKENENQRVILSGWVHKYRNLGGLLFIDLRDRYGVTQVIFDPETVDRKIMELAAKIRNEYVLTVEGTVKVKPDPNKKLATGEIEVMADALTIENTSDTPPFNFLDGKSDAKEDLRLEYRYLDMRSEKMVYNMTLRHKVMLAVRNYLSEKGFLEIETPTFSKSTPEGARDYLVPSRIYPGHFFALPQSPQIYKQLLMVGGLDKYFQIARCYRDEDSRGDRQPEFTQIDVEMSFVDAEDIYSLAEGMFKDVFKKAMDKDIKIPFQRLTYNEAMESYGVDKPDLRFGLELKNITDVTRSSEFGVFKNAETVKFIAVEGLSLSRKEIGKYEDYAKHLGAKGLAFLKFENGELSGGIFKFLSDAEKAEIIEKSGLKEKGMIFFGADTKAMTNKVLGNLRNRLAKDLNMYDKSEFKFCWVTDFPMFEYNEEEGRWAAMHHMFTMPKKEHIDILDKNPEAVLSDSYDLVLNGVELCSGSIRIHNRAIQQKIFEVLGMSEEEIEEKFGFMLKAFRYGAPPHGGFAPGLDRLLMLMAGEETIREVIAFPKATNQTCPMMDAPSNVDEAQLKELKISLEK